MECGKSKYDKNLKHKKPQIQKIFQKHEKIYSAHKTI